MSGSAASSSSQLKMDRSLSLSLALWTRDKKQQPCRESLQPHPPPNLLLRPAGVPIFPRHRLSPPPPSTPHLPTLRLPRAPPPPSSLSNSPFDVSISGGDSATATAAALFVTSSVVDAVQQRVEQKKTSNVNTCEWDDNCLQLPINLELRSRQL